jgi:hypothetical protein
MPVYPYYSKGLKDAMPADLCLIAIGIVANKELIKYTPRRLMKIFELDIF